MHKCAGLGFVVETCDDKEILFTCELCDIVCNSNNMVVHIIGLKHRMAYMVCSKLTNTSFSPASCFKPCSSTLHSSGLCQPCSVLQACCNYAVYFKPFLLFNLCYM